MFSHILAHSSVLERNLYQYYSEKQIMYLFASYSSQVICSKYFHQPSPKNSRSSNSNNTVFKYFVGFHFESIFYFCLEDIVGTFLNIIKGLQIFLFGEICRKCPKYNEIMFLVEGFFYPCFEKVLHQSLKQSPSLKEGCPFPILINNDLMKLNYV